MPSKQGRGNGKHRAANQRPGAQQQPSPVQSAPAHPEPGTESQAPITAPVELQNRLEATAAVGTQTVQQERAKYALDQVQAALGNNTNAKEFRSYASGFPAMIQMNGLGQAAAFYFSQGGTYRQLYDILSNWLMQQHQPYEGRDLLVGITDQNMQDYRLAQAEALLLLDWVKRFAKAYVRD